MTAHRFQATWRSITFNEHYTANDGKVDDPASVDLRNASRIELSSLDLSPVAVADLREARQLLEGADANDAYETFLVAHLRGFILGSSVGDLEDRSIALREALSPSACRYAFAANDPPGLGAFGFRLAQVAAPGYKALQVLARPFVGRPVIIGRRSEGLSRAYSAQLLVPDPKLYAASLTSSALADLAGGANVLTPGGNVRTPPVIEIVKSGAGGPYTLTNGSTGQSLSFDLSSLAAGKTLRIYVDRSSWVQVDTGANLYAVRTAGFSSEFLLLPTANTITFSPAAGITSVTLKYRAAWA